MDGRKGMEHERGKKRTIFLCCIIFSEGTHTREWKGGNENGKDKLASSCSGLNIKQHTIWLKISHDSK